MDFRKLSYYEAVCRLGNFTKAANELHVSQPSVTTAIQNLEDDLQVRLIIRERDGLTLTEEGKHLYKKAKHILKELEEAEKEIKAISQNKKGNIRLGYTVQMGMTIPKILEEFSKINNNLNVFGSECPTPLVVSQVEDGSMDLGLVVITKDSIKKCEFIPLFQGEIRICISHKNPISKSKTITLEEFQRENLVSLALRHPKDSFIFKVMEVFFEDIIEKINPKISTMQLETFFRHIANNDGVGLTFHDKWFDSNHEKFNSSNDYCEISFNPPCTYSVGFIFRKNDKLTKEKKSFIEFVKNKV